MTCICTACVKNFDDTGVLACRHSSQHSVDGQIFELNILHKLVGGWDAYDLHVQHVSENMRILFSATFVPVNIQWATWILGLNIFHNVVNCWHAYDLHAPCLLNAIMTLLYMDTY